MISGDFTQGEADDLAKLINYGALPVQLEELTVENVSPTLGNDQLDAGIVAGIIGLAPRRALHARLLPAARARRDRSGSLLSGVALVLARSRTSVRRSA